jgi:hypothetical protein
MKTRLILVLALVFTPIMARADGVADFARAQVMFAQAMNAVQQYKQVAGTVSSTETAAAPAEPAAPTPLTDKSGKFCCPYDEEGHLVGWANKAIGAQVGAAVGSKVGEKAGGAVLSKVPFGGLLSGAAKKKGKELGALAAVGGPDFVKSSSTISFNSLEDLSLYLHLNFAANPEYVKGLAAALAIYPDLEKTYAASLKKAYAGK